LYFGFLFVPSFFIRGSEIEALRSREVSHDLERFFGTRVGRVVFQDVSAVFFGNQRGGGCFCNESREKEAKPVGQVSSRVAN
jgi:hypothetical protein